MSLQVKRSFLSGEILLPTSKSHSQRAILFAALAKGQSILHHVLDSPDIQMMITACQQMGANIAHTDKVLFVTGVDKHVAFSSAVVDSGNSGIVFRFIAAIAALSDTEVTITGDHSIMTRRPIVPLLDALNQLGCTAYSQEDNGQPPVSISGHVTHNKACIDGADSQPVSALLILCALLPGVHTIEVRHPGEKPWVNLTLAWLARFGARITHQDFTRYEIDGAITLHAFEYTVPCDWSSAAFPLVAACVTQSCIKLLNAEKDPLQGDQAIVDILIKMGASIQCDGADNALMIDGAVRLQGGLFDINHCVDAVCILSVLACFAQGETYLCGAEIAAKKESNRLAVMAMSLNKMGATVSVLPDGLHIIPAPLSGCVLNSFQDHRVAMALAVAGLGASGETIIEDTACIAKSFPSFVTAFQGLGAKVKVR